MSDDNTLLWASFTVNLCVFSFFGIGRLVSALADRFGERLTILRILAEIQKNKPWFLGKTLTEVVITSALIILSVPALSTTSVFLEPFTRNETTPLSPILSNVISMNIGRYLYMCVQNGFLHDELRHFVTNLIHHVVTTAAYTIFLYYQQNIFLCVASLLMELNTIPIEVARIARQAGVAKDSLLHRRISVVSCAVTMTSRGALPIILLTLALKHGSPFTMQIAPLTTFFMCIVFFFVINFWLILQSVSRVVRYSSCGMGPVSNNTINFVTNQMEPQLCQISFSENKEKRQPIAISNFNYGYSKPYDNRNICNENQKNNVAAKSVCKANVFHKGARSTPAENTNSDDVLPRNRDVVHVRANQRVTFEDETVEVAPFSRSNSSSLNSISSTSTLISPPSQSSPYSQTVSNNSNQISAMAEVSSFTTNVL